MTTVATSLETASIPVAGTTTHTQPSSLTRYPALDGLRAVAFLMVVLQHYYHVPWGFGGVNLFFVLSGFLITGILDDTRDRADRARSFYIRRTLRIFPLYYGVLLAILLSTPIFHWIWSWQWIAWPLYVGNFLRFRAHGSNDPAQAAIAFGWLRTHTSLAGLNLGHFWSLCVEEQFYLIWPWVVFATRSRKKLIAICAAVVVISPFLRAAVQAYIPAWATGREFVYVVGVPFQLDSLLLGALLALLWRAGYREILVKICRVALTILMAGLLLYIIHVHHLYPTYARFNYVYPEGRLTWGLSLINLYGATLLICALKPGSLTFRCLNLRPLRFLGRISYGAYILHDLPHPLYFGLVTRLLAHRPPDANLTERLTMLLALVCTILLASLSYRYFETPFLNLKERWAPSRRYETRTSAAT